MRFRIDAAALLLTAGVVACGGNVEGPDEGSGGTGRDGDRGGEFSMPAADPLEPADCMVGDKRDATDREVADYCLCTEDSQGATWWICYGPDPDSPPAGGARGAPPADCGAVFVQGTTSSDCLVSFGTCSDGHAYAISCVQGACFCVVDSASTVEPEPNSGCPEDLQTVNERCGWALE